MKTKTPSSLVLPTAARWSAGALVLLAGISLASQAAPPAKPKVLAPMKLSYNGDVRPILAENCFACHGPDSASRKAGLRLDRRGDATMARDGGSAAIVPGNPQASELIRRIIAPDDDPTRMPPAMGHKSLTKDQKQVLTRWITEGAVYDAHWAYIPPQRAPLPVVKNTRWAQNPIDRFVLAKLEANGLTPAPQADRRTLARRLSLDLTGLPPDPAEVERFVGDKSPNAYEKLVDKYLASPHWGEHRGRYWLDAARYADTHGIHFDNYREMWSYRDWVINAFNQNKHFDQFTLEQLAGDLLPNATLEQRIASGFNRCNITTNEGGSIAEEVAVMYDRDRTETTTQVFLGTTAGCAVCHDHKFDPISQKEFYSLAAYFNNTTQNPLDGNVKDTAPIIPVPIPADRARLEALKSEITQARTASTARKTAARTDFDRWLGSDDARTAATTVPTEALSFYAALNEGQGSTLHATLDNQPLTLTAAVAPNWDTGQVSEKAFQRPANGKVEVAQAGDFEKDQKFSYAAWVKLPKNGGNGGSIVARMDDKNDYRGWDLWVENNRIGSHIISKWPTDALKAVTREPLSTGVWHHVCVTYDGGAKPNSLHFYVDGMLKDADAPTDALKGSIRTTVPLTIGQRHTTAGLDGTSIQDLRLYRRVLNQEEVGRLRYGTRVTYLASRPAATLTVPEKDELFDLWLVGSDAEYTTLTARTTALTNEQAAILQRGTIAHVWQEKPGEAMAYVLFRGEYDKRRDPVKPSVPAALPPMPADFPRNRLGLARWLLLPNNPLTARVTVNRFWQEIFGAGIVRTTGDFGVMGEMPSHQELLDWLAVDFQKNGWDVKRFFKQIVMSATYQQATVITPEKKQKDPMNKLLSRGTRFRMDAEMVRDYALASSGLLVEKVGGPSVRPYQPDGVWEAVAISGSNTRFYKRDMGENLYRRSMYTLWKRSAPPASMEVFNAPSREVCTVRRERTNTPLQALVTMNDPQFIEAARYLAQRTLKEGGVTPQTRANFLARHLLARPLIPAEQAVILKSVTDLEGYYQANPKDAQALVTVGDSKPAPGVAMTKLAAWTMLTNQMMNLDEVLNK